MSGAALLVPGDRLDRYAILFEIARGGMASVYAARRTGTSSFDRVVALKVPLPHLRERPYVDLFLSEAKIASAIEHVNVVQVFDLGEHEGVPFLVMEYVRGRALGEVLARVPAHDLRLTLALHVLAKAGEGLHAAHTARGPHGQSLGIVHRDVSPQNVLVGYAGEVKVADFGIAHAHDRPVATRTGELRGKLQYLAPEQISRDEPVSARTDVWSLGVVAWEALMQRPLFLGANDAETLWNVCAKTYPGVDLPAALRATDLERVLEACLCRRPSERPASAAEFAGALREALSHAGMEIDIARTMNELFAEEMLADGNRLASAFAERGDPLGTPRTEAGANQRAVPIGQAPPRVTATDAQSGRSPTGARDDAKRAAPRWRSQMSRRKRAWLWVALVALGASGTTAWAFVRAQAIVRTQQEPSENATLVAPTADPTRAGSSGPSTAVLPSSTHPALPSPSVSTAVPATAAIALTAGDTAALSPPGPSHLGGPAPREVAGRAGAPAAPSSAPDARRHVTGTSTRSASTSAAPSPLLGNPYASPAGSR